jgi:hypothetical protein
MRCRAIKRKTDGEGRRGRRRLHRRASYIYIDARPEFARTPRLSLYKTRICHPSPWRRLPFGAVILDIRYTPCTPAVHELKGSRGRGHSVLASQLVDASHRHSVSVVSGPIHESVRCMGLLPVGTAMMKLPICVSHPSNHLLVAQVESLRSVLSPHPHGLI